MIPVLTDRAEAQQLGPKWLPAKKIMLFRALPRPNRFGCQFAVGMSADAPETIRAFEGTWSWGDEPAAYAQSMGDAKRDALLQMTGRVRGQDVLPGRDWTGTNEGDGTRYYELQTADRDDVRVYTGSTLDNLAYVGQEFIDEVTASLPAELLGQYLHGGVGQLAAEMAAWEWSKAYERECTLRKDRPLETCWDFGIRPMAMSYCQQQADGVDAPIRWLGEVVMPLRGNTADVTRMFCERMRPLHPGPVIVDGDASGKAGSAQSKRENYQQIEDIMQEYWPGQIMLAVRVSNPAVLTRQLRANAAIKRGLVWVDPACKNLLRDLNGCRRKDDGKEDQRDGYSHSLVGMFYRLHNLYPIREAILPRGGAKGAMVSRTRGTPTDPSDTVAARLGR